MTNIKVGFIGFFSLALAAVGCTLPQGAAPGDSNGAASGGGASGGGAGSGGTTGTTVQELSEAEPNDGPDFSGMQNLGTFAANKSLKITGKLASGGNDGQKYTGDTDAFAFEVPAGGGKLSVKVDWNGSADVDAILYDKDLKPVAGDNTSAKPMSASNTIPAGKYALVLFSKDQAADWTIEITYTSQSDGSNGSSGGSTGGTIDQSALTEYWWQPRSGGILEQIKFNADGSVNYEYYNSVSGASPYGGSYQVSGSTIVASLEGGSTYQFAVVDGGLVRNGIRWIRCTQPVSSGKCF